MLVKKIIMGEVGGLGKLCYESAHLTGFPEADVKRMVKYIFSLNEDAVLTRIYHFIEGKVYPRYPRQGEDGGGGDILLRAYYQINGSGN